MNDELFRRARGGALVGFAALVVGFGLNAVGCSEDDAQCETANCTSGPGGNGPSTSSVGGAGSGGGASVGGSAAGGAGGGEPQGPGAYDNDCDVTGDFREWHRVSVACVGPAGDETDSATFTDHRMNVTFTDGSQTIVVPAHFAADGNAGESGAATGTQWRAYFMPPTKGKWSYSVSFRVGTNVAVDDDAAAGAADPNIDGFDGAFDVATTDKSGRDMRGHGLLEHLDGDRYLRHRGSGTAYLEGGVDSPENLFGYSDFDNTTKQNSAASCKGILHDFAPHAQDWVTGDPTFGGGRGKNLIGLVNYLATTGTNAIYLVPMSEDGDGCDAHPWATYGGDHRSFDVSKLDQWEVVFAHMTAKGFLIHFVTQETENDGLLNNGNLGTERRLYYREIVSRFAHHPALQWNLGEENTNSSAQQMAYASYFKNHDPYDHAVLLHTYPNQHNRYNALLGFADFDGPTLQYGGIPTNNAGLYGETRDWIQQSAAAGQTWVVTATEASGDHAPLPNTAVTPRQRIYWMYANAMAGGGGTEWYLKNSGAGHAYDLAVEDMREFDAHWLQMGHMNTLFNQLIPSDGVDLNDLTVSNNVTTSSDDWVLAKADDAYLFFLREGGDLTADLSGGGTFKVTWFNPRTGQTTDAPDVDGNAAQALGMPPTEANQDWAVWVRR